MGDRMSIWIRANSTQEPMGVWCSSPSTDKVVETIDGQRMTVEYVPKTDLVTELSDAHMEVGCLKSQLTTTERDLSEVKVARDTACALYEQCRAQCNQLEQYGREAALYRKLLAELPIQPGADVIRTLKGVYRQNERVQEELVEVRDEQIVLLRERDEYKRMWLFERDQRVLENREAAASSNIRTNYRALQEDLMRVLGYQTGDGYVGDGVLVGHVQGVLTANAAYSDKIGGLEMELRESELSCRDCKSGTVVDGMGVEVEAEKGPASLTRIQLLELEVSRLTGLLLDQRTLHRHVTGLVSKWLGFGAEPPADLLRRVEEYVMENDERRRKLEVLQKDNEYLLVARDRERAIMERQREQLTAELGRLLRVFGGPGVVNDHP